MEIFNGICHEGRASHGINIFVSKMFLKNKHLESFPDCKKRVLHILWALNYKHIEVEVTMNMAEYTSNCQFKTNYKRT